MSLIAIAVLAALAWIIGFVTTVYLDHALVEQAPTWNHRKDWRGWAEMLKFFIIWPCTLAISIYDAHKRYG